jgi:hypothetical protein
LCIEISEPFERDRGKFICQFNCREFMLKPRETDGDSPEEALASGVMIARAFLRGFGGVYVDDHGNKIELPSSKDFDPDFPVEDDDYSPPDESHR